MAAANVRTTVLLGLILLLVGGGATAAAKPGNGGSGNAAISADGRFVAIASAASDLVARDTNGVFDVFLRDRRRHMTERMSVGPGGRQANARTGLSAISANGRFVVMWSEASNLAPGDTNRVADVFLRDRIARRTERVSIGPDGKQLADESGQASISANGRFVAFTSAASVFVRDRVRRVTEVIGRGATPALSASGRYVAFNDGKSGLVVRDRSTGLTEMISVDAAGMPLQGIAETPTISANGRFVSFLLMQRFPDTPKFEPRLYVRDRATQTTKLVATSAGNPTIAPDGRTIAYQGGIPGGAQDVIMLNLISGRTEVVSVSTRGGTENGPSFTGSGPLNTTGRFVAFFSDASNLVPRDTNHATDVFVRDRHARTTSLVSVSRAGP